MTRAQREAKTPSDHLTFLAQVSSVLTSAPTTFRVEGLARIALPHLGDWCTVRLFDDEGAVTASAQAHRDAKKEPLLAKLVQRYPLERVIPDDVRRSIEAGEPHVVQDVTDGVLAEVSADPEHARLLRELGTGSVLILPLTARGQKLGAMLFAREAGPYGDDELIVAKEFARRAALALDNARLFHDVERSNDRFQTLVHSLDAILWEAETDPFRFTFVSQGAEELLGYPTERWTEDPDFWRSVVLLEDRYAAAETIREVIATGEGPPFDYRVEASDGRVVWLRTNVDPERDEAGTVVRLRGITVEITSQKHDEQLRAARHAATEALSSSRSLTGAADRLLPGIGNALGAESAELWVVADSGSSIDRTAAWTSEEIDPTPFDVDNERLSFAPGTGLPGLVWRSRTPQAVSDLAESESFERMAMAASVGLRGAFAFPVVGSGTVVAVLCFYDRSPVHLDEDMRQTLAEIGRDIGTIVERWRSEVELTEREARRDAILKAATDCIITIDENGTVREWNPAAESTFGYTRDEAMGRTLSELIVPGAFRDLHESGLERVRATAETSIIGRRLLLPAVRKDGTELFCEITITQVDIPDETLFTGFLRDITRSEEVQRELRFRRTLLESIGEASIDGIVVMAPDGTVLWSNERFAEVWGLSDEMSTGPDEVLRHMLTQMEGADEHLSRFLELASNPREERRTEIHLRDGRTLDSVTAPIRSSEDVYHGRAWYFRDVTDQKRTEMALRASERRFALLAEASNLLAEGLDYEATLRGVAELAVPGLADGCVVFVLDEDGITHPVATADRHTGSQGTLDRLAELDTRRGGLFEVATVLDGGQPVLHEEVTEGLLSRIGATDEQIAFLRSLAMNSLMSVPMIAGGTAVGVMTFFVSEPGRRYEDRDLEIAQELAVRAAFAVDNARLFEDRAQVARTLQRSLLPPALPQIPGIEVAARYHPAGEGNEVGGDFYDVFQMPAGMWAVVVGDVCGKGAEAAAITALARYGVRTASIQEQSPRKILGLLNETIRGGQVTDRFCTAAFARVEPGRNEAKVTLACGGHPLPYVVRRDRTIENVGTPGRLLGVFDETDLTDTSLHLGAGESLILYTDGVPEGRGPTSVFGHGMMRQMLRWTTSEDAGTIADRIVQTCIDFQKGRTSDDIAVLVLRVPKA